MAGRHVEKRVAVWCWYRWHETHPDEECSSSSQCEGRAGKALGRNASNVGMTGVLRNVRAYPLRSGSRVDSVPASNVTGLTSLTDRRRDHREPPAFPPRALLRHARIHRALHDVRV